MNVFAREKELFKLFKTKESVDCAIVFVISAEMVTTSIFHTGSWSFDRGKFILVSLWKNFKLSITGWKELIKGIMIILEIWLIPYPKVNEFAFKQKDRFLATSLLNLEFATNDSKYQFVCFFSLYFLKINNVVCVSPSLERRQFQSYVSI